MDEHEGEHSKRWVIHAMMHFFFWLSLKTGEETAALTPVASKYI